MSNAETAIQNAIRKVLGREPDLALQRNHVGSVLGVDGFHHTFGLGKGSFDLVGALTIRVPDTIVQGGRVARLFCLEVKTPTGAATKEQKNFARVVRMIGGFAAFVRSPDEARAALARARAGASE